MSNCKEFFLDDVLAITAIPVANYSQWNASALMPVIQAGQFNPSMTNAVTVGQQPAVAGGSLVPIVKLTGKARDEESDETAGRRHTVTVSCEVDDRDGGTWTLLRTLETDPRHLILTFRNKERAFVAASQDTYRCEVSRDGAKTQLQFHVECLSGIQLVI